MVGFVEGMAVGVLARAVGGLQAGHEPGGAVDFSPMSGSVWNASIATRNSSINLGGTTRTRDPAAVLRVGLYGTATIWPWSSRTVEGPPSLALDGEQAGVTEVDDVADEIPKASEMRRPMIRCSQNASWWHRVQVGSKAGRIRRA